MGNVFQSVRDFARFRASFGGYILSNNKVGRFKKYPVAGAVAEFEHGAGREGRVTLSRVALTGIFALGLKKDRNKVYVAVELADGQQLLIEDSARNERQARRFANKVNAASEYYAAQEVPGPNETGTPG